MGKREIRLIPIKWLFLGVLLIATAFVLYLLLWSTPADKLESKYIQEAGHSVENVNHIPLSGGGLALVSEDTAEKALMQIYAKVPILNRYMYTESWDLMEAKSSNDYAVRVWSGNANLRWEKDKVKPTGWTDDYGWGVQGPILFRFFEAELFFIAFVLIRNDVIKTRRERVTNPSKNY